MSRTVFLGVSRAWNSYTRFLDRYPGWAQALNTSVLMSTGDIISQVFIEKKKIDNYDVGRTVRFFGVGLLIAGPGMHVWYSTLDRVIRGPPTRSVAKKVLMDQCFFLPFYLGVYIGIMALLRRENIPQIKGKLNRDFTPLLKVSYQLWPAVQVVNFYLVPLQHRILVINFVGLLWNTYIGWKAEQEHEKMKDECRNVSSQESVQY